MCGDIVIALRFTGQPGAMRAVQRCEKGSSPGKSGESGAMGGEMSQSFFMQDERWSAGFLRQAQDNRKYRLSPNGWRCGCANLSTAAAAMVSVISHSRLRVCN